MGKRTYALWAFFLLSLGLNPANCQGENITLSAAHSSLASELDQLRKDKASSYEVRTVHLAVNGPPKYINCLIREDSPYLLQHAHNPVEWYPWGEDAFAAAKKANKPVFLSIGYSTCHWCHVMEVESFDNEEVAEILNKQ